MHLVILILNGLTQGALFFVLGSGLTLAFGLMNVVNMSHGAFYLLGGYLGITALQFTGNWLVAVGVGGLSIALLGLAVERGMLARVREGGALSQTLLTIALSMIIADMALAVWGGHPLSIQSPAAITKPVTFFGVTYPGFRYVLMAISVAIALLLWLILYRTRFGLAVRATVDDRETASALGVRIDVIYSLMFMLSALLGGVAGVLGGTYLQLQSRRRHDHPYLLVGHCHRGRPGEPAGRRCELAHSGRDPVLRPSLCPRDVDVPGLCAHGPRARHPA